MSRLSPKWWEATWYCDTCGRAQSARDLQGMAEQGLNVVCRHCGHRLTSDGRVVNATLEEAPRERD